MPAPHRRSQGESLAKKMAGHAATRSIDDRRDRLRANKARTDAEWQASSAALD